MRTNSTSKKHIKLFDRVLKIGIAGVMAAICFSSSILAQTCMDYYRDEEYVKAIQCFGDYIKKDPKDVDALYMR
jgi:hypothetical protein